MQDFRLGKPVVHEHGEPSPGPVRLLAAPAEQLSPEGSHPVPELLQGVAVGWYGMVPEVAADNLLEPLPLLADRLVDPPTQFLLDCLEFCLSAVAPGLPFDQEAPPPGCSADEGEAQEVEGFRLAKPVPPAVFHRVATELNQPGLLRMERQCKFPHPFAQQVEETPRIGFVLETDNEVVGVSHDDDITSGLAPSPAFGIEVEE